MVYADPVPAQAAGRLQTSQDAFLDIRHLVGGSWLPVWYLQSTEDAGWE